MINPSSPNVKLALEVLIQGLQDDPDYAMEWARAIAIQVEAAGLPENLAYKAAAEFMWQNLRTFTFSHPKFPHCQDALRKAAGVLEGLGWEYRAECWRAPAEPEPELEPEQPAAPAAPNNGVIVVPVEIQGQGFDEKRMDIIGQNGNSGEHYTDAAKAPVTFRALADKVETPKPALRRADPVKVKPSTDLPDTSGMVDPTGRPKWADIPAWVDWLGQDRKGAWTGFANKPEPRGGRWFTTKRYIELNSGEPAFAQDYTETLEQRP